MTANQLQYWSLREQSRANRAKEDEMLRSNQAKEKETLRSNQAQEKETHRANLMKEAKDLSSMSPTQLLKYYTLFHDYVEGYPLANVDKAAKEAQKAVDWIDERSSSTKKGNFSGGTSHSGGGGGFRGGRDPQYDKAYSGLSSIFK